MPLLTRSRHLENQIFEDLQKKMVFIGGARQVGKKTATRSVSTHFQRPTYLSWDNRSHRQAILQAQWAPETDLLVFDEFHKYDRWKSLIKGIWDTRQHDEKIIVTGSSRLDIFRRGGDSLLGRFHYYRLHPFTLREMEGDLPSPADFPDTPPDLSFDVRGRNLDILFTFGGFPEPALSANKRVLKRWQKERFERVFREDIRETEIVRALSQIELLGSMFPLRVASPLSVKSLSDDLEASPKTVKSWIELLARNYFIFRVPPYHNRLDRALKKESKYYLWDWSEIEQEGARFENMIASHLLKFCHYHEDSYGINVALYYLRDLEKREVDFLIVWNRMPWLLVECKLSAPSNFTHLNYFAGKLEIQQKFVVTMEDRVDYVDKRTGIRVIPAKIFLMALL